MRSKFDTVAGEHVHGGRNEVPTDRCQRYRHGVSFSYLLMYIAALCTESPTLSGKRGEIG